MKRLLSLYSNLPIERKLLLASVIPVLVLILLSLVTYRSVRVFSDDEEQLSNIYLVQRKAAEYMRLIVDLETGFRGYVLTQEEGYLNPYRSAQDRILAVGDMLVEMVGDREVQRTLMVQVQALVRRLMSEKDALIQALRAGDTAEVLQYMEQDSGRAIMVAIRQQMHQFDRLEQDMLMEALARLSLDRTLMTSVILGGGVLALVLMVFTLHIIARSIAARS